MNRVHIIWNDLAKANSPSLLKKLYSADLSQYIYCIYEMHEKYCGIAISYSAKLEVNISQLNRLKDVSVYIQSDTSFEDSNLLIIKLSKSELLEIFAILCENLISAVSSITDQKRVIKKVLEQLEKWKALFDSFNSNGLSAAEQQGLYGELFLLRKFLNRGFPHHTTLSCWVGVDRALRDFQYRGWALEVKTTVTNNHQRLSISSERQLDENLLDYLYLYHLSVETSDGNGESLNQIITEISELINSDFVTFNLFNQKLMEVGYFEKDKGIYNNRHYKTRNENFYKIEGDFPRIKESELRDGIGDVKYSVIIDNCNEYLIPENTVFNTVNIYARD
ncbi:hypothetical protein BN938_1846 [Mucinivorans hirudinis]|uniref:PD-(D/E)XK motif protein n=1 Tax=Mucinivorans hirudinis TaxID=1433126 RepID=A0A060R8P8_9BACT|nr:hypothetical protein BN938_1846 [Mucinivorans hirudinis]